MGDYASNVWVARAGLTSRTMSGAVDVNPRLGQKDWPTLSSTGGFPDQFGCKNHISKLSLLISGSK